ncbi:MAG: hypothetical protein IJQ11_06045 [Bacteroidales bacterium]|nr:hypothetical protein [Bacteroidales bacterium]
MKKTGIFAFCAFAALVFASCNKTDYTAFVGTWGVEKIEYYNIDYAGNPIDASMTTYYFDPNNTDNGIRLVFRENKTGEMLDSAVDTVWYEEGDELKYIVNPDTTLVTTFTYSYDNSDRILYMNMEYVRTYQMRISNLTADSFVYENEYMQNYVEKAYVKRITNMSSDKSSRRSVKHSHKPGAFLGRR